MFPVKEENLRQWSLIYLSKVAADNRDSGMIKTFPTIMEFDATPSCDVERGKLKSTV